MAKWLWRLEDVSLESTGCARLVETTLSIGPGVTAVLGASGAGKTSLLNLLVGYEKPTGGQVRRNLTCCNGHAAPLYWSPQENGLWPHMTAGEHVRAVSPLGNGHARDHPSELLEALDLSSRAGARPGEMSQGERARLTVARALATRSAVLVMDEPMAHVDEARLDVFWQVIRHRLRADHTSLVFSTHQAQRVLAEADQVVCLDRGRILYAGPVWRLYREPANERLARCLGEVNWLDPEESELWLQGELKGSACYRPQELEVVEDPSGSFVVVESRFRGVVTESHLRHATHGQTRRFVHRSGPRPLCEGMRVWIRVVALMLILVWIGGCDESAGARLDVRRAAHWALPPQGATLPAPRAVAPAWEGEMVVLDTAGRVLVFDEQGVLLRKWFMPKYDAGKPEGVCLLKDGRLVVADTHYHRLVFFDRDGRVVGMLGEYGTGPGQFIYPVKVARDDQNNLYVAEYGSNDRVQKFSAEGQPILSFGTFGTEAGQFQRPGGLVWNRNRVYVTDATNHRVQAFTDEGKFLGVLNEGEPPIELKFPYDLAMGTDGNLYVAEWGAGRVTVLSTRGRLIGRYGHVGSGENQLVTPWGLAVGRDGELWVADTGNRRMVEIRF